MSTLFQSHQDGFHNYVRQSTWQRHSHIGELYWVEIQTHDIDFSRDRDSPGGKEEIGHECPVVWVQCCGSTRLLESAVINVCDILHNNHAGIFHYMLNFCEWICHTH
jgi:hypothetical protein